jgi:hypothetical protein
MKELPSKHEALSLKPQYCQKTKTKTKTKKNPCNKNHELLWTMPKALATLAGLSVVPS